jgi:anti-sigma B factor antagonist
MAFDIRVSGEHAKVVLSGDVDLQTTADLKAEIQEVSDVSRLEIEATDVTYIDSSGVAVLLLARQHCAQNNITLAMPSISEAVHRVLQIARLDAMLPIGVVVAADDSGLMGLGVAEDAPADDDDLVNALLADGAGVAPDDMSADDLAPDIATHEMTEEMAHAGTDHVGEGTPADDNDPVFEGLDISNVDFSQPAEAPSGDDADMDDPDGEDMSDPIMPGTFN